MCKNCYREKQVDLLKRKLVIAETALSKIANQSFVGCECGTWVDNPAFDTANAALEEIKETKLEK